jgi:glycerol kinase
MNTNILAIDQGTTNTKALLIALSGRILARGSQPTAITYPQPGWVEQDALEIWRCTCAAIEQCLAGIDRPNLAAVAISNQRETALVWDRATGQPVGPAVVWQCKRSAPFCNELKARGLEPLLQERTGLQVDAMFSASKIRWLLDHIPDGRARAAQGELCAGNIDSWLLWNLTGGQVHATDVTNASRTQLMGLRSLDWDAEVLDIFGIPRQLLPTIRPSSYVYGETIPTGALPGGLPIASLIGDSHASLYGLGGFRPGSIKATYGTGSSLMMPIARPVISGHGLSTTVAWGLGPSTAAADNAASAQDANPARLIHSVVTYALEGNIYATGAAVQWVGELLGLTDPGPEVEKLACSVEDTAGVYFVPALAGLGAPHWSDSARGLITGLTRGATGAHLARAAVEAMAYQVRDVFDAMQADAGAPLRTLLIDGGASRNNLLLQFQADLLDCEVLRSTSSDVSPLGAAFLAGLAAGVWANEAEIEALVPPRDRFTPQMSEAQRAALYAGWQAAVARTVFEPTH